MSNESSGMIYPTTIPPAPILGDLATPVYTPALPPNHIFEKSVSFSAFSEGTYLLVWCRSGSLGASGLGAATTNYHPAALRTSPTALCCHWGRQERLLVMSC